MNSETYNTLYDINDDIALLVLKALHFETHGKNKEGYTTITKEDCRDFILSVNYYNSALEDNPFDKEEYIEKFIKDIQSREIFDGTYSSFKLCFHLTSLDDYFCDYACYLVWKKVTASRNWLNDDGENISESRELSDVFNILCFYFENPGIED